ncbi:MAG: hypothetical protein FIA97_14185 [Methylococcaceae bacterium]|nr:hypothetical protein [Methylococcaceae bacterium]
MLQPKSAHGAPSHRGDDQGTERTDYLKEREADFLLIEFGKLQDEILSATRERWRVEQTVFLLNAILLAVGYLAPQPVSAQYFTLPFLVTLLGAMRHLMVWLQLRRVGNYLTKVEEIFGVHPRLGWELRLEKLDESKPYTLVLVALSIIYWLGMLAATFILALGHHLQLW